MNNKIKLLIVVAAVLLLGGAFLVLRPEEKHDHQSGRVDANQEVGQQRTFELNIAGGKVTNVDSTLKVRQGDRVTIKVTADAADELHLHGYDKTFDVEPGKTAEQTFVVNQAGRFEAEMHDDGAFVFALEVQPE